MASRVGVLSVLLQCGWFSPGELFGFILQHFLTDVPLRPHWLSFVLFPRHTENAQGLGTVALMSLYAPATTDRPISVMSPVQGILRPYIGWASDQLGEEPILHPRLKGPLP